MDSEKQTNPVKAIRAKCLECSNGSSNEVRLCPIEHCPLFPFRFGKNPYRAKRELTEEQREAMAARLSAARHYRSNEKQENGTDGE